MADERGVVGYSLIRWSIILVILGLVAIEGGSIIFTSIGLQNAADAAAVEAADVWNDTRNISAAEAAARNALDDRQHDEAVIVEDSFQADRSDPFEVRFDVTEQAATLVVHRIGFLEDLAEVTLSASARPIEAGV
jgi:uncharacterized membrane protein